MLKSRGQDIGATNIEALRECAGEIDGTATSKTLDAIADDIQFKIDRARRIIAQAWPDLVDDNTSVQFELDVLLATVANPKP